MTSRDAGVESARRSWRCSPMPWQKAFKSDAHPGTSDARFGRLMSNRRLGYDGGYTRLIDYIRAPARRVGQGRRRLRLGADEPRTRLRLLVRLERGPLGRRRHLPVTAGGTPETARVAGVLAGRIPDPVPRAAVRRTHAQISEAAQRSAARRAEASARPQRRSSAARPTRTTRSSGASRSSSTCRGCCISTLATPQHRPAIGARVPRRRTVLQRAEPRSSGGQDRLHGAGRQFDAERTSWSTLWSSCCTPAGRSGPLFATIA